MSGLYPDGGGLYLQVGPTGAKSWIYRFMLNGKAREMGLGPLHTVPLSEARVMATECRRLRMAGVDPIEARVAERNKMKLEAARAVSFKDCAESYIQAHRAGWRSTKHAAQWTSTLTTYVYPVFGSLPVQSIDVGLVMKVLEPIWATKPETATRIRGRIEAALDWATARVYRRGDNPARWRGHLENLLPPRSRVKKIKHYAALPYDDTGAFMAALRQQQGVAARALEFLVLTASRPSEVVGAEWQELDLGHRIWTIPGPRMKSGRAHRVPLSAAGMDLIQGMRTARRDDFVFPGRTHGRPLSSDALLVLLKRMGRPDLTAHGFRSTFRDWAAERTDAPSEVAEIALGHAVGNKVEVAYRRGDLFEKRRRLMEAWATYCAMAGRSAAVVAIRA